MGPIRLSTLIVVLSSLLFTIDPLEARPWRALIEGDLEQVVARFERRPGQFSRARRSDLLTWCGALKGLRRLDALDACVDELERRVAAGGERCHWLVGEAVCRLEETAIALRLFLLGELGQIDQQIALLERSRDHFVRDPYADGIGAVESSARVVKGYLYHAELGLALAHAERHSAARAQLATLDRIEARRDRYCAERSQGPLHRFEALERLGIARERREAIYRLCYPLDLIGYLDRARLHLLLGDPAGAYRYAEKQQLPERFALALWQQERPLLLAESARQLGRLSEARSHFERVLAHPTIAAHRNAHRLALQGLGLLALAQGRRDQGIERLRQAVEIVEQQRRTVAEDAAKIGFLHDKAALYGELVAALIAAGREREAFEYAERAKGRALVELLADLELAEAQGEPLLQSYLSDEQALLNAQGSERAAAAEGIMAEESSLLGRLRGSAERARQRLLREAPAIASLVTVDPPRLSAIQAKLPPGTTLLEYFAAADRWWAFVVTRDRISATPLPVTGDIERQVAAYRHAIARELFNHRARGERLYRALIAPVERSLGSNLVIVPHGALHQLPFAALPVTAKETLLDRYRLSYLPSAGVMSYLSCDKARSAKLLAIGNPSDTGMSPLPAAEREAEWLAARSKGARLLLGDEATESRWRDLARHYDLLHIASHGLLDPNEPLRSRLLLTPDRRHDGELTAAELYQLELDAELVTLSACQTGLGRVTNGDEVIGLTRGFLSAGARAVLSSLWKVDDAATATLMQAFYRARDRLPLSEALRTAQRQLRAKQPHPFYWAAFRLTAAPGCDH